MIEPYPDRVNTMPARFLNGFYTATGQEIENPSQEFVERNFIPETYQECKIDESSGQIGPFYQVCDDGKFEVCNKPLYEQERLHFCGYRMPDSPNDARKSWAIGNWGNSAKFCREFYLKCSGKLLAYFEGVPRYFDEYSDLYVEGTDRVINLNNNLSRQIEETARWVWDDNLGLWTRILII